METKETINSNTLKLHHSKRIKKNHKNHKSRRETPTPPHSEMNININPSQSRHLSAVEDIIVLNHNATSSCSRSDFASQNPQQQMFKTLNSSDSSDIFFKTRLCQSFKTRGVCQYYDGCSFAHGLHELRSESGARVCKMYYRTGICSYGVGCSYLHVETGDQGLHASGAAERKPASYKVKPCFSFRSTGRCSYGAHCIFIHGDEEVKKIENNFEPEIRRNAEVPEESGRSTKCNFFTIPPRTASTQKTGAEKLRVMKKIVGIYGDWPD